MLDVVTLGEAMVLLVPTREGLLRHATRFERFVAGAESNLAVGLARLGHRVGWVSRVGDDEFGESVLTFLRGEAVDVSRVAVDPDAPTGVFFKERRRAGSTRVFYYRANSAASRLSPADLDADYLRGARWLHLTGITPALGPECLAAVERAIDIADEAGIPVSFDPNLRLKLWSAERARPVLLALAARARWVLASADEAAVLTGERDPERAARVLRERGGAGVVVKLGEEGALGLAGEEVVHAPALPVNAVETVGAGDAFDAGFVSGCLRGWPLAASLRLGNVLGALATTVPGDVEGLPTWREVQPYLGGEGVVER